MGKLAQSGTASQIGKMRDQEISGAGRERLFMANASTYIFEMVEFGRNGILLCLASAASPVGASDLPGPLPILGY